jgi:MHS family metabolite:H+ symporter-like MFS transporter
VTVPTLGALSDRIGRTPVVSGASLFLALYAFPSFWMLKSGHDWLVVASVAIGVSTGIAAWFGAVPVMMTELFSIRVRYTGIALAREASGAAFGGTAPILGANLVSRTGSTDVVAIYMVAARSPLLRDHELPGTPDHRPARLADEQRASKLGDRSLKPSMNVRARSV